MSKITRTLLAIFISSSILHAEENIEKWNQGFEKGNNKAIFKSIRLASVKDAAGVDGSRALVLEKAPEKNKKYPRVMLRKIEVDPTCKYRLSFSAYSEGPDTLDKNPLVNVLFFDAARAAKGKPLPGWELLFSNSKGKRVKRSFVFFENIIHGKWHVYTESFYPPEGSKYLNILFTNKNKLCKVYIDNIKLKVVTDEDGTLNLNPEFKYGLYDYSGYYMYNTKITQQDDGKFAVDVSEGSYVMTTPVPVKTGKSYSITVVAGLGEKRCSLTFSMINHEGKRILAKLRKRESGPGEKTFKIELKIPENIKALSASFNGGILKSIKIKECK
jgi:hypothetical protein